MDDCLIGIYIWVTHQRGLPSPPEQNPKASIQQNTPDDTIGSALDETRTVGKLFLSRMPAETKRESLLAMVHYGLDQNFTFGLPLLNTDKRVADAVCDVFNTKFGENSSQMGIDSILLSNCSKCTQFQNESSLL